MTQTILDADFTPPLTFVPIDDAARDGTTQLVRRGSTYSKARWTGTRWIFPNDAETPQQPIGHVPTHYAPRDQEAYAA